MAKKDYYDNHDKNGKKYDLRRYEVMSNGTFQLRIERNPPRVKYTERQVRMLLKRAYLYVPKAHYELKRPIEEALGLPRF